MFEEQDKGVFSSQCRVLFCCEAIRLLQKVRTQPSPTPSPPSESLEGELPTWYPHCPQRCGRAFLAKRAIPWHESNRATETRKLTTWIHFYPLKLGSLSSSASCSFMFSIAKGHSLHSSTAFTCPDFCVFLAEMVPPSSLHSDTLDDYKPVIW